ncbi:Hypothetical predicted protein [Podarcis lilfordi]|uniref:Uncharacterized protein n=1 Tax=Podarcis lilfordi TaxID=74358 RepID=A0AA35KX07_9SAUR|nr:Hypothetical predicted protein [Podarcis lilfordi]
MTSETQPRITGEPKEQLRCIEESSPQGKRIARGHPSAARRGGHCAGSPQRCPAPPACPMRGLHALEQKTKSSRDPSRGVLRSQVRALRSAAILRKGSLRSRGAPGEGGVGKAAGASTIPPSARQSAPSRQPRTLLGGKARRAGRGHGSNPGPLAPKQCRKAGEEGRRRRQQQPREQRAHLPERREGAPPFPRQLATPPLPRHAGPAPRAHARPRSLPAQAATAAPRHPHPLAREPVLLCLATILRKTSTSNFSRAYTGGMCVA